MSAERPPTPTEDRLRAWRRACLAYREIRDAGGINMRLPSKPCSRYCPLLSQKEAGAEAVNAVAYATKHNSEWFWRAAQHTRKWLGTEY